jgi:DNA modification methylase
MACDRKIGPYPCCSVVQGDCLELMKQLPTLVCECGADVSGEGGLYHCVGGHKNRRAIDAIITDPPYGISADVNQEKRGGTQFGHALAPSRSYGIATGWDGSPCKPEALAEMRRIAPRLVIFGGNYFDLPPSRCWLVWDKQNGANEYADCELAWTNLDRAVRRIYHQWHGMIREGNEERFHPTQKPERVMAWCIEQAGNSETILDPFCGSGTTLVAAKKLGRHFLGFEISPEYCAIARDRLDRIDAQPSLFAPKPEQLELGAE